jgi:hypothetical protein
MIRASRTLALLGALSAATLAACAGEPSSGASRESSTYSRFDDVDRFPQPRGSSAYLRQ